MYLLPTHILEGVYRTELLFVLEKHGDWILIHRRKTCILQGVCRTELLFVLDAHGDWIGTSHRLIIHCSQTHTGACMLQRVIVRLGGTHTVNNYVAKITLLIYWRVILFSVHVCLQ